MRDSRTLTRGTLVAAVALVAGLVFGEVTRPAPLEAQSCPSTQCMSAWGYCTPAMYMDLWCDWHQTNPDNPFAPGDCETRTCGPGTPIGPCGTRWCQE